MTTATATATATRLRRQAPQTAGMRREELQGRAAGVIVGAVFGLTWAASALPGLDSVVVVVPVLALSVATFAVLMTGAHRLRRSATLMPASPVPAALGKVQRRFTVVVAIETVAIIAAANILARSGHSQWIPAVICALVGLHFIPLARLFSVPLYYATASALCLVAGSTMNLGASGAQTSLWQLLPGFGAALVLWATSAGLLATTA
jgi:hypothetical protein